MNDLEHSPLGGSAAHRFINCAGSFLLQREQIEAGQFEAIESEWSKLGTAAHALCAASITTCREPFEFIGNDIDGYKVGWPGGISLNAAHVYFAECMRILDEAGQCTKFIEASIHLPEIHPLLKGTVDFGVINPAKIWLRDYKNGEGVGVSAPNNKQLLYYGALLIHHAGFTEPKHRDIPVSLGIVQPNFYGIFEGVDEWETTVGFVLDWMREELLPRMNSLAAADQITECDFVTGEHCQFCPVLLECPKMQKAFTEYADASEDFITMLTSEELDHFYAQRENARRFMNALETTVHARLMTGAKISSAKLVEKQVARVWKPGGVAAIEAAFGEKAYKPREPLSPAGVEKLSSRGKELALEYGYKPESAGLVVAPISDRRPEAKARGNAGVFEDHAKAQMDDF